MDESNAMPVSEGMDPPPPDLDGWLAPVPDAVDLVLETSTMMSVIAAQRLLRIESMRREQLAEAAERGAGLLDVVERSIRLELAAAMRITEYAAGRLIMQADALVNRYHSALDSLAGGRMTERHAEVLVDVMDELPPEVSERNIERAVMLAEAEPVGAFRRSLRRLAVQAQAASLEERHAQALRQRRVVAEHGADGMGVLLLHGPTVEAHAIFGRLTAMAKAMAKVEGETRTLDQLRADIAFELLVDGSSGLLPATASGIRASVVVTVPVLSLLDDDAAAAGDPPVVEGVGPVPLSKARELCGGDSKWMRVLTHPETGMVLSVGRDRYEPPAALRKLVKWRADRCMAPGCGVPASRCDVDHQVAWADGGETCLCNNAPFCKCHHLVKHHGGWLVRQIEGSGGVIEWISPTGRRYVVQPERRVPVFTVGKHRDAALAGAGAAGGAGNGDVPF
jgi:hypothetical protein